MNCIMMTAIGLGYGTAALVQECRLEGSLSKSRTSECGFLAMAVSCLHCTLQAVDVPLLVRFMVGSIGQELPAPVRSGLACAVTPAGSCTISNTAQSPRSPARWPGGICMRLHLPGAEQEQHRQHCCMCQPVQRQVRERLKVAGLAPLSVFHSVDSRFLKDPAAFLRW
jgi:hypothetical protein